MDGKFWNMDAGNRAGVWRDKKFRKSICWIMFLTSFIVAFGMSVLAHLEATFISLVNGQFVTLA